MTFSDILVLVKKQGSGCLAFFVHTEAEPMYQQCAGLNFHSTSFHRIIPGFSGGSVFLRIIIMIDVSHMSKAEYRDHMRRLEELTTCPCMKCTKVCDRASTIAECDAYHEWWERNIHRRKKHG